MKSEKLIRIISLALALIGLVTLLYVDKEIATTYEQSDGKTKAMFGIIEITRFTYKYLILIPAVLSIVLTVILFWKRRFSLLDMGIAVIAATTFIGTVTSSWRLIIER